MDSALCKRSVKSWEAKECYVKVWARSEKVIAHRQTQLNCAGARNPWKVVSLQGRARCARPCYKNVENAQKKLL